MVEADIGDWFDVGLEAPVPVKVKMDTMVVALPNGFFFETRIVSGSFYLKTRTHGGAGAMVKLTLDEERHQAEAYALEPAVI